MGFKYKAFISYSHKDRHWAQWLHKRLEAYSFPKNTIGQKTHAGAVPANLRPIFSDREELTAGAVLGQTIDAALQQTNNLIVICSPQAAQSHWVNEEILYFKRHNRGANIFALIIDGEPFAPVETADQECFPPALRFQIGEDGTLSDTPAEPLAADLRDNADGKRLGLLKLISGMVGLGLDDLVQRDLQRARKRVTTVTASAIAALLVMSSLTWLAIDARGEAEKRRNDAEGQIEFMLTDLKDKLNEVGRLDALQVVGDKAAEYYDNYPITSHDDDALGRRSRVYHYLGKLQDDLGNLPEADKYFEKAFTATSLLLDRAPKNPDRIFEHAQSAFWVGYREKQQRNFDKAKEYFDIYMALAVKLNALEDGSFRAQEELSYAFTNSGKIALDMGDHLAAADLFSKALSVKKDLAQNAPENKKRQISLALAFSHLSDSFLYNSNVEEAIDQRLLEKEVWKDLQGRSKDDAQVSRYLLRNNRALSRLYMLNNDFVSSQVFLKEAKKNTSYLISREPQTFLYRYEKVLVDVIEFEQLIIDGQIAEARKLSNNIDNDIRMLPSTLHSDYRYRQLKFQQLAIKLNIAVHSDNAVEVQTFSQKVSDWLESNNIRSYENVLQKQYAIYGLLLVHLTSDNQNAKNILDRLCASDENIEYGFQVILAAGYETDHCRFRQKGNSIPPNIMSSFVSKLHKNKNQ